MVLWVFSHHLCLFFLASPSSPKTGIATVSGEWFFSSSFAMQGNGIPTSFWGFGFFLHHFLLLLVLSRECGNEPEDSLTEWFIGVIPSFPAEHQQELFPPLPSGAFGFSHHFL